MVDRVPAGHFLDHLFNIHPGPGLLIDNYDRQLITTHTLLVSVPID